MKISESIIVERVGNGYQVRPFGDHGRLVLLEDVMVFQDKGFVSTERENQSIADTLFGWIDQHFHIEETKK